MAFAPIALGIAVAASAAATIVSGVAAGRTADYNAQVARNEAQTAQQNAAYAAAAGSQRATEQSMKEAAVGGKIRTAIAASGIDVNSGSAEDVQESQRRAGKLDTLQTEQEGILQNYGYRAAASTAEGEASLYQSEADIQPLATGLGVAGTLAGGASSLAFNWGSFGGGGAPGSDINPAGGITGGGYVNYGPGTPGY